MVHPLIEYGEGTLRRAKVRDGILRENRKAVGMDHFRNAVVDLRIQMIRPAGQHNALGAGILHEFEYALALCLDVSAALQKLVPPSLGGG